MAYHDNLVRRGRVKDLLGVQKKVTADSVVTGTLANSTLTLQSLDLTTLDVQSLAVDNIDAQQINATSVDADDVVTDTLDAPTLQVDALTAQSVTVTGTTTTTDVTVSSSFTAPEVVDPVPVSYSDVTTPGSTTIPFPTGLRYVQVEVTGAGGGGGGGGDANDAGAGGGSGGYAEFTISPAQLLNYTGLTVEIGTGGAGGTGTSDGSAGGLTRVLLDGAVPQEICSCGGGQGGTAGSGTGLAGSPGSLPTFTVVSGEAYVGQYGQNGRNAGTVVENYFGGNGGTSRLGAPGRGAYDLVGGEATVGLYGGGGGGGINSTNVHTGVAGGNGRCFITWYTGY